MNVNNKIVKDLDWLTPDTFVCSDHHFGHKNILGFEPCRVTAMNIDGHNDHTEWLIECHNQTVGENDTVLFIGDFAFNGVAEALARMNGKKYIILGNHDKKGSQVYALMDGVVSAQLLVDWNGYTLKLDIEDPLFSGIIKSFGEESLMFSHYSLFHVDEWDRNNKMIMPRIDVLEQFYNSFGCTKNVHGHLHSTKSTFRDSVNVCLEHINFRPKRLRDLIEGI